MPNLMSDQEILFEDTDEYELHIFDGRVLPAKGKEEHALFPTYSDFNSEILANSLIQSNVRSHDVLQLRRKSNFFFKADNRDKIQSNGYNEKLVCDICGITYKTKSALNVHIDMHNGICPYKCDICGKQFTQKGALTRHKPIHTGERPYQCDKCGKQFIHYSSFHMHKLAHDDVRNKKCTLCGLLLRSTSHLNRHILVHTGQKPHACPICGQRFAQRYNMMSHLRSHQGIHRKKKLTCHYCGKSFLKEVNLQEHIAMQGCRLVADTKNLARGRRKLSTTLLNS